MLFRKDSKPASDLPILNWMAKIDSTMLSVMSALSRLTDEVKKMSATQETEAQAVAKLEAALTGLKNDVSGKLASLTSQLQQAQASQDFSAVDAVTAEIQAFQAQIDGTPATAASGADTVTGAQS